MFSVQFRLICTWDPHNVLVIKQTNHYYEREELSNTREAVIILKVTKFCNPGNCCAVVAI